MPWYKGHTWHRKLLRSMLQGHLRTPWLHHFFLVCFWRCVSQAGEDAWGPGLDSQNLCKKVRHGDLGLLSHCWGYWTQTDPYSLLATHLDKSASSRPMRDIVSTNKVDGSWAIPDVELSDFHKYTCVQTHTYTLREKMDRREGERDSSNIRIKLMCNQKYNSCLRNRPEGNSLRGKCLKSLALL